MINGLVANSSYSLRFMGLSEAGSTSFSNPIEIKTTEPWAPEPVAKYQYYCYSNFCCLMWPAPEDNGALIEAYTIFVSKPDAIGEDAFVSCL